jgi:hypothetical protein
MEACRILGVDFTSAPCRAKAITAGWGRLRGDRLELGSLERLSSFVEFEALLARPGPWLGAFDFPFGMPRELVRDLGWPAEWPALVRHCATYSRQAFRNLLDIYRAGRALGNKFAHRATDLPAGSSSPMKLANPPVALMFLEGAPRLLRADVTVPGMHAGDGQRIAVEGYPGLLARRISRASYKSDARSRQTDARRNVRAQIVAALERGLDGLRLELHAPLTRDILIDEGSADNLDAALCAFQAARAAQLADSGYGMPAGFDPVEGWIAGADQPAGVGADRL